MDSDNSNSELIPALALTGDLSAAATGAADENALRLELTQIYNAYAPSLLRFARAASPDRELGRDAVQETFFRYFVARREGTAIENERAWLFRVLRSVVADQANSSANRSVPLDQASPSIDPRAELDRNIHVATMSQRLSEVLSHRELECFRLRSEGLQYEEIGATLKLQSGTVGALLTRAMTKLRRAIKGEI